MDFPFVFPILKQIFDEMEMTSIQKLPFSQFYDLMQYAFHSEAYRYSYRRIWVHLDEAKKIDGILAMYSDRDQAIIDLALRPFLAKVGLPETVKIFTDKEAQKNEWYLDALAVDPKHWRQGIGGQLLSVADKIALQHGYHKISLNVDQANTTAQRLYQHKGFVKTNEMMIGSRRYDHMIKTLS